MTEIRLRHELDCDEQTFWDKCVFNDAYNQQLYIERLKFPRYELVEMTDLGSTRRKRVDIDPPLVGVPGALKKLIGDRLSYLEEGTYETATNRYTFKVTPSTLADKTKIDGVLYTQKLGDTRCARIVEVNVTVKVFAVGSLVEEKIAGDLRSSYEASAGFTNEFVREHSA